LHFQEIEKKRIAVDPERLHDTAARKNFSHLLAGYTPLWLKLGLDVTGKPLPKGHIPSKNLAEDAVSVSPHLRPSTIPFEALPI